MGTRNFYYNDTQNHPCTNFCSNSRTKYILLTIVVAVLTLGIGFSIGYVTKKDKITSCNSPSTDEDQSTQIPISRSTLTTTTTVKPLPIRTCPPTLPQPTTSNVLLSLDKTITLNAFKKYTIEYTSPANVAKAMITFEFNTVWGSWYLDDVSVKETGSNNPELIDNGGFETGNLGSKWNSCDPRYPWIVDGTIVSHTLHAGTYSYEPKDPGVGSQEYLTQILNIKSQTRYTIQFYIFYSGEPSSIKVTIIS